MLVQETSSRRLSPPPTGLNCYTLMRPPCPLPMSLSNHECSVGEVNLQRVSLEPNTIHVWRISLHQNKNVIDRCKQVLSTSEVERASRFHFQRDRDRFVIAHGAIRQILGTYLKIAASDVPFHCGPHGKPEIAPRANCLDLRFNLSHSGEVAVAAVTRQLRIGIDIECVRPDIPCVEIAKRHFSADELASLKRLKADCQREAFFGFWTCKEAYVKARGRGLSVPLDAFEVAFGAQRALTELTGTPILCQNGPWMMYAIPAPSGYRAALVVEGREHQIEHRKWGAVGLERVGESSQEPVFTPGLFFASHETVSLGPQ